MTTEKKIITTTQIRAAGDDHQVVTVVGGTWLYRKRPCSDCPWRRDSVGVFPAEAFVHSASTAHDMSTNTFACHQSGKEKPAICAGFLLRGADHNLAIRLKAARGEYKMDAHDGGHELHHSYRAMALANGVKPCEPALKMCRAPGYQYDED